MVDFLDVDGAIGEGGGQVLRTALSLSVIIGTPIRVHNIRAGRRQPGLRPQHMMAVNAAARICGAQVLGLELGSKEIKFIPGKVTGGNQNIEIGTAGSTSLVFQTIAVPLSFAARSSRVKLFGGTHVPWSPCYHYLALQWLTFVRKIGYKISLELKASGFYPKGGGSVVAIVKPVEKISALNLTNRGALIRIRGFSAVANLPRNIAERQRAQVVRRMGDRYPLSDIRLSELDSPPWAKGTMILLLAEFQNSQACYFSLGKKGKPAERVADEAIDSLEAFLSSKGVIDEYLADQILLPLVFAAGKSVFRTSKVTQHLLTNAQIIKIITNAEIIIDGEIGKTGLVQINPFAVQNKDEEKL